MKKNPIPTLIFALTATLLALGLGSPALADGIEPSTAETPKPPAATPDLEIRGAQVRYLEELDLLVFEQRVAGEAGGTVPEARGQLDGAPVLGYVFPTTLSPEDVGFGAVEGTVALAATSHPDFDDTPLWDEDGDRRYDNPGDGAVFHTHWVVLVADDRVPGGLSVRPLEDGETVPATHPGMPIHLDSPGLSVVLRGDRLKILVPAWRVGGRTDFNFDAVTAYMQVSRSVDRPMLGVYHVYGVLSKDLSLPYQVEKR